MKMNVIKGLLKGIIEAIVMAAFIMLVLRISSDTKLFWPFVVFFFALGKLYFSEEIVTYQNYVKAFKAKGKVKDRTLKFKKLERISKHKREKIDFKIHRAILQIEYNTLLALLTFFNALGSDFQNWGVLLLVTGIILLVFPFLPIILSFIFSKINF